MSEPRFTKGPWKFNGSCGDEAILSSGDGTSTGYVVAVCDFSAGDFSEKTAQANSCLIAAAPEMYVILKKVLYNETMPDGDEFRKTEFQQHFLDEIVKILKKAGGEK